MGVDATGSTGSISGSAAPCLAAPTISQPSLPLPFTLPTLSLATPKLAFTLCCTITLPNFALSLSLPPIPMGLLGPGAVALVLAINEGIDTVNSYLDLLVLKCPIE